MLEITTSYWIVHNLNSISTKNKVITSINKNIFITNNKKKGSGSPGISDPKHS